MSLCTRCGAAFGCAMADGADEPCWCTRLPPVVPVPAPSPTSAPVRTGDDAGAEAGKEADQAAPPGCWCPACLEQHIARAGRAAPGTDRVG